MAYTKHAWNFAACMAGVRNTMYKTEGADSIVLKYDTPRPQLSGTYLTMAVTFEKNDASRVVFDVMVFSVSQGNTVLLKNIVFYDSHNKVLNYTREELKNALVRRDAILSILFI